MTGKRFPCMLLTLVINDTPQDGCRGDQSSQRTHTSHRIARKPNAKHTLKVQKEGVPPPPL
jgi:hypothetical protein